MTQTKQHNLISFFLFALQILFVACETPFTYNDIQESTEQMVVGCTIMPDSLFSCYISHTYILNDTTNHDVEDAVVKICGLFGRFARAYGHPRAPEAVREGLVCGLSRARPH